MLLHRDDLTERLRIKLGPAVKIYSLILTLYLSIEQQKHQAQQEQQSGSTIG